MGEKKPDFSGWATKNNLKCSDGRTIMTGAFKHQDRMQVPLVWQHDHNDPGNILGHAILEDRAFGVWTRGYFNESQGAIDAREAVIHGDINALSIYANKLKQRGTDVLHGNIIEVSLVMAGANPGAFIENVHISHGEGGQILASDAIIYTGLTLEHQDNSDEGDLMAQETETTTEDKTVDEILNGMTEEQKNVMFFMIGQAMEDAENDTEGDAGDDVEHSMSTEDFLAHIDKTIQEGINEMGRNTFETFGDNKNTEPNTRLSHSQFAELMVKARSEKVDSWRDVLVHGANDILEHADGDYGITDIALLFPDAKNLTNVPDFISRRMEWVNAVLTGTKHSPFAKVKTIHADITAEEARAKGYIKGKEKKEEVIKLLRRTTGPTTVYKKQKLDRDDIIDITDFDVVLWLQGEIRLMLEEEIARAILIGDGRSDISDDKVKDPAGSPQGDGIRSILHDNDLYAHKVQLAANVSPKDMVKGIVRARTHYRGSGKPSLFISDNTLTDIMLEEDRFGRPLYETEQALADKLRVDKIVTVDLFDETEDLMAIMVNLQDYTIGANKGGEITNFEDFDIDFNQNKYLSETRISGALTKPKSAIVIKRAMGTEVTPTPPTFVTGTNTITIPTKVGVEYRIDDEVVPAGTVVIEEDTTVEASPDEDYYFSPGATRSWGFTFTA